MGGRNLLDLPLEVLSEIFFHAFDFGSKRENDIRLFKELYSTTATKRANGTRRNTLLVSRRVYAVAAPILYSRPQWHFYKPTQMREFLANRSPGLVSLIRYVSV
jgi:hypothetical protein